MVKSVVEMFTHAVRRDEAENPAVPRVDDQPAIVTPRSITEIVKT